MICIETPITFLYNSTRSPDKCRPEC